MSALAQLMTVRYVRNANRATPTGDPSFVVQQSMPGPVSEEEADPFLMCDEFGPTVSQGAHGTDSDQGLFTAQPLFRWRSAKPAMKTRLRRSSTKPVRWSRS